MNENEIGFRMDVGMTLAEAQAEIARLREENARLRARPGRREQDMEDEEDLSPGEVLYNKFHWPEKMHDLDGQTYVRGRKLMASLPRVDVYDTQALDRVVNVIQILGHKGIMATPDAGLQLAFLWYGIEWPPIPSSVPRAMERAVRLGLARVAGVDHTFGGRGTKFYALTERGKEIYRTLWERPPNEGLERSMERHGGEQAWPHTALVAATAGLLDWVVTEEVDRDPPPLRLGDHLFAPDLAVWEISILGRRVSYIECERQKRSLAEREQKWRNAYQAGEGEIYVVCPVPRVRQHFVRQIKGLFAGDEKLQLYATDIKTVRTGELGADEFWVEEPPWEERGRPSLPFWIEGGEDV